MRRHVAAVFTGAAILFAILLGSAPRLHDYLHQDLGAGHECAATIFAAGKCDVADAPTAAPAQPIPIVAEIRVDHVPLFVAAVPFSILEHAPPRAS